MERLFSCSVRVFGNAVVTLILFICGSAAEPPADSHRPTMEVASESCLVWPTHEEKTLIRLFLMFLSFTALAGFAQTVTVSGTRLLDGSLPASGTIYFEPVLETGQSATYQKRDGQVAQITSLHATVRSGGFALTLPDTSHTQPTNLCFAVTLKTPNRTPLKPDFDCVQPHAVAKMAHDWCHDGNCNFDDFVPVLSSTALIREPADVRSFAAAHAPAATVLDTGGDSEQRQPAFRVATVYNLRGTRKGNWSQGMTYGYGDIVDTPCGSYMSVAFPNLNASPSLSPNSWLPLSSNCSSPISGTLSLNANLYSSGFHIYDAHKNRGLTVFLEGGYSNQSYTQLRSNAYLLLDGFGGATGSPVPSSTNTWSPPGGGGNAVWAIRVGYWDSVSSSARSQRWSETDTPIGLNPFTGIGRTWAADQGNLPYRDQWVVPAGSTIQWIGYSTFTITSPVRMSVVQQDAGIALAPSNITLSAGWGSHATVTAIKGYSNKMRFTITAGAAPTPNPAISVTFPTPFVTNSPICTPSQIGGTGSQPKALAHGTETTTSTGAMTWIGTPVAGSTYEVEVSCE